MIKIGNSLRSEIEKTALSQKTLISAAKKGMDVTYNKALLMVKNKFNLSPKEYTQAKKHINNARKGSDKLIHSVTTDKEYPEGLRELTKGSLAERKGPKLAVSALERLMKLK